MRSCAYVIHLDHSSERKECVERISVNCPVPTIVCSAVDGNALESSVVSMSNVNSLHAPTFPFPLRRAEIGLFMSHRSCWQRIVDEGVDAGLVFEDDAELGDDFGKILNFALDHIGKLGFIEFQVRPARGRFRIVATSEEVSRLRILEPQVVPLRTNAQLVSRDAARKLLAATERFDRPVDSFLQLRQVTDQRIFVIEPSGVSDSSVAAGGSTIHSKKKQMPWLEREFKRFVYRARVRRMSRQYWNSVILSD